MSNFLIDITLVCPYCGGPFMSRIDTSAGDFETVEDCGVCCRPMKLNVRCSPGEIEEIEVQRC